MASAGRPSACARNMAGNTSAWIRFSQPGQTAGAVVLHRLPGSGSWQFGQRSVPVLMSNLLRQSQPKVEPICSQQSDQPSGAGPSFSNRFETFRPAGAQTGVRHGRPGPCAQGECRGEEERIEPERFQGIQVAPAQKASGGSATRTRDSGCFPQQAERQGKMKLEGETDGNGSEY